MEFNSDFRPMSEDEVLFRKKELELIPSLLYVPDNFVGNRDLEEIVEEFNVLRVNDYPEDLERIKHLSTLFHTTLIELSLAMAKEDEDEEELDDDYEIDTEAIEEYVRQERDEPIEDDVIVEEIEESEEVRLYEDLQDRVDFSDEEEEEDFEEIVEEIEEPEEIKLYQEIGETVDFDEDLDQDEEDDLTIEERVNLALFDTTDYRDLKNRIELEEELLNLKPKGLK